MTDIRLQELLSVTTHSLQTEIAIERFEKAEHFSNIQIKINFV